MIRMEGAQGPTVTAEQSQIVCDPKIRFGKPCIRGTRVAVSDVLRWFGSGMSAEEIVAAYPHLTREGLNAALWCLDGKQCRGGRRSC